MLREVTVCGRIKAVYDFYLGSLRALLGTVNVSAMQRREPFATNGTFFLQRNLRENGRPPVRGQAAGNAHFHMQGCGPPHPLTFRERHMVNQSDYESVYFRTLMHWSFSTQPPTRFRAQNFT